MLKWDIEVTKTYGNIKTINEEHKYYLEKQRQYALHRRKEIEDGFNKCGTT